MLVFALLATWAPAAAQRPVLRTVPADPVQGTLFQVVIDGAPGRIVAASGRAADQPLHFDDDGAGRLVSLAGAPLDTDGPLEITVVVVRVDGGIDSLRLDLEVGAGSYPLERLTVAPRFGTPPDSATQARLARDRALAAEVARRTHETPRLWRDIHLPRDTRITSVFGSGREFNGQVQSRHTGTDFQGGIGAPVNAAARGVVALSDTLLLAGRALYIDHGAGLVTAYFHLSEALVEAGDTVQAGQTIGRVGASGRVTGPHLHWVVRYGPISVDPLSLLALRDSLAQTR